MIRQLADRLSQGLKKHSSAAHEPTSRDSPQTTRHRGKTPNWGRNSWNHLQSKVQKIDLGAQIDWCLMVPQHMCLESFQGLGDSKIPNHASRHPEESRGSTRIEKSSFATVFPSIKVASNFQACAKNGGKEKQYGKFSEPTRYIQLSKYSAGYLQSNCSIHKLFKVNQRPLCESLQSPSLRFNPCFAMLWGLPG